MSWEISKKMRYGHGEHLEMELEVVLWICFSRRTLFLVFEEKIFFQLFFGRKFFRRKKIPTFFDENPRFSIFDDGSDIVEKSSKKVGKIFSMKKFSVKKKSEKYFFFKN